MATAWGKPKGRGKFYKGSSKDTDWNKDLLWKKYVDEEAKRNGYKNSDGLLLPGNMGNATSRSVDSQAYPGATTSKDRVQILERQLAREVAAREKLQKTVEVLLDERGVFAGEDEKSRRVLESLRRLRKLEAKRAAKRSDVVAAASARSTSRNGATSRRGGATARSAGRTARTAGSARSGTGSDFW
jgi:hypothetical protein